MIVTPEQSAWGEIQNGLRVGCPGGEPLVAGRDV